MTLLEPTPTPESNGTPKRLHLPHERTVGRRGTDLRDTDRHGTPTNSADRAAPALDRPTSDDGDPTPDDATVDDLDGGHVRTSPGARRRNSFPALRLGRVRVLSLAKIAFVFSVVGFLVSISTVAIVWNVLLRFGLVESAEEAVATGLGLDEFTIAGGEWFGIVVAGMAMLFAFLLLVTILLALVYNATCTLFGGVAIEARPVRRLTVRQRFLHGVRSWREARA